MKEAYGSKQDIVDINVKTNVRNNMNQQEVYEAVSPFFVFGYN